ncbi:hypothetical protein HK101_000580, partial [Irineochytrium annulatum]
MSALLDRYEAVAAVIPAYANVAQEVQSQAGLVRNIEQNLAAEHQTLAVLQRREQAEAKDVKKIENGLSLMTLGAKMKGKKAYEDRKAKEHAELDMARQDLMNEQARVQAIQSQLDQARMEMGRVNGRAAELESHHRELINILNAAFANPGPEHHQDSSLVQQIQVQTASFAQCDSDLQRYASAQTLLQQAQAQLNAVMITLSSALQSAQVDLYYDNAYSEINEYQRAQDARNHFQVAGARIREAAALVPQLPSRLGISDIGQLSAFGTLYFDNVFSDLRNIQQLQNSMSQAQQTLGNVQS